MIFSKSQTVYLYFLLFLNYCFKLKAVDDIEQKPNGLRFYFIIFLSLRWGMRPAQSVLGSMDFTSQSQGSEARSQHDCNNNTNNFPLNYYLKTGNMFISLWWEHADSWTRTMLSLDIYRYLFIDIYEYRYLFTHIYEYRYL